MIPETSPRRDYERPHEPRQCGHACGQAGCLLGPTTHGTCQAGPDCQPVQRQGEWQCVRSMARGGPCPRGPSADGTCGHVVEP